MEKSSRQSCIKMTIKKSVVAILAMALMFDSPMRSGGGRRASARKRPLTPKQRKQRKRAKSARKARKQRK
jgi:hypothetical protein